MVKLDKLPDKVKVAKVCVDHVPAVSRPPVELACSWAFDGRPPPPPVGVEPLLVVVPEPPPEPPPEEPDLGGYFSPEDAQVPFEGASIGSNLPSMREPCTLKYHSISFKLSPSQFKAGVTPEAAFKAEVIVDKLKVLLLSGVIPACESQSNVGRVLNSATTVLKKATASAPLALPLGRQDGSRVL